MLPSDTSSVVQKMMDDHYRGMEPKEKGEALRRAWCTARALQLAGLRARFPADDEAQLENRLSEIWLGPDLFRRVRAWQTQLP